MGTKTNAKVDTGNKSQTGKTNDSTRARIVIGQSDGEEKHVKQEMRKWGLQIASLLQGDGVWFYIKGYLQTAVLLSTSLSY